MPVKSRFPDVHIPDVPPAELLLQKCKEHGDGMAFIDSRTERKYTFRQVHDLSLSLAVGLHHAGLRKGDVVAICLPNCPEYCLIFLAVALRGGVTSGVNTVYTKNELRRHFEDSGCKFVFTSHSVLDKVHEATEELQGQVKVSCSGKVVSFCTCK